MVKKRYVKAHQKTKGELLDEMEAITALNPKTLIRLMNGSLERKPRRRERGATHGPQVDDALRVICQLATSSRSKKGSGHPGDIVS